MTVELAIQILELCKPLSNEKHYKENINTALLQLKETQKELEYIHRRMKESLSSGNKAQILAFAEVYNIINNRIKSQE